LSEARCRNTKINNRSGKIYAKLVAATENYKHNNREFMKVKNKEGNTKNPSSRKCDIFYEGLRRLIFTFKGKEAVVCVKTTSPICVDSVWAVFSGNVYVSKS
jgi:hypothetical protein